MSSWSWLWWCCCSSDALGGGGVGGDVLGDVEEEEEEAGGMMVKEEEEEAMVVCLSFCVKSEEYIYVGLGLEKEYILLMWRRWGDGQGGGGDHGCLCDN